MVFELIAAGIAADFVTGLFDAEETVKGIRKGVAVEGNPIIVKLFSNKPKLSQLDIFNISFTALFALAAVVAYHYENWALLGGSIGALYASAGLHVRGVKNWQYLMAGGNPNPKQSAFQKIIGFLSWNQDKK